MRKILFTILFLVTINRINAQSKVQDSLIGLTAPKIDFDQLFSPQLKTDFNKGKVLVLDFWATWCAPCIAAFPHMNQLSDEFKNKEVVFAAISDETETTVNTFFNRTKKEFKLNRLLDVKSLTFDNFYVNSIPFCVIIDQENKVRWVGNGSDLTSDILNKVIENKDLHFPKTENVAVVKINSQEVESPLFNFSLSLINSKTESSGSSRNGGDLGIIDMHYNNISFGNLLQNLTGYSKSVRINSNDSVKLEQHIRFDYTTRQIKSKDFANKYNGIITEGTPRTNFLIHLLEESMNCKINIIEKIIPLYELKIVDSVKFDTFKSLQDVHSSSSGHEYYPRLEIVGYNIKDISRQIEIELHKVVNCETEVAGKYDISLDFSSKESLDKALKFHGLALKEKKANTKFLNVEFR